MVRQDIPTFVVPTRGCAPALAFGVPEEEHDTTVLKLGMLAARLGSDNIGGAERLADVIASKIVETCECSPAQETELAFNGSL